MKSMKKLLFVFPVAVLLAAGCNSSQPTTIQPPIQNPVVQNTNPAPVPAPMVPPSDANQKTFSNDQYGFEFQYQEKNLSIKEAKVSSSDLKNLVYIANIYTIPAGPHSPDREGLVGVFNVPFNQALEALGFGGQQLPTVSYNGIIWSKLARQDSPSDYLVEKNGMTFWLAYGGSIKQVDFDNIINTFKFTTTTQADKANWRDTVLGEFSSLTAWQQSSLSDWLFADYTYETQHRSQLKTYGTGQILLLSKSFNQNGCQLDCSAEGVAQNTLTANIKKVLADNGWHPVTWPSEPGFYTDNLYVKDGHPLILQIGTRDAVTGGMYVAVEFQY